ncbi:TBC1 domain, member 5 [Allomyces javanicus]|nr:TBC1 domain, member 5 [Allomyces javanicus]
MMRSALSTPSLQAGTAVSPLDSDSTPLTSTARPLSTRPAGSGSLDSLSPHPPPSSWTSVARAASPAPAPISSFKSPAVVSHQERLLAPLLSPKPVPDKIDRWLIYLAAATNQRLVPDPTAYLALCDRFYVNPRGESPTNLSVSPLNTSAIAAAAKADAPVADHPLSQATESTWSRFFVLEDVRELIRKDVSRTFQEDEFFQSPATQDALTRMLCVFTLSKRIAYKQGMHELAAVLFWTTWNEKSVQLPPDHVEATAYTLYEALMVLQAPFFEGDTAVQLSARFFHVHLRAVNDELYHHLTQLGIEPHLFGLRWLRLLFAREYPLPDVAHLWDGLFCLARSYPTAWSDHLAYIAATTLLGIRDLLMHDDYSTAMAATMHARSPLTGPDVILQTVQFRRQFAPVVFDLAQRFDAKRAAAANAPIRPRTQHLAVSALKRKLENVKNLADILDFRADVIDRKLDNKFEFFYKKFQTVESALESVEKRLESVEKRLESVETRLESVETRLESVEKGQKSVEKRLELVEKRQELLETQVIGLKTSIDLLDGMRDRLMHDADCTAMAVTIHARPPLTRPSVILQTV